MFQTAVIGIRDGMYPSHLQRHADRPRAPANPSKIPAAIRLPKAPAMREPEKKMAILRFSSLFVYLQQQGR